ncbi:MAG: hypothetical protein GWO20_16400 [Candidatus Korarchaeota archaeon]|nr:hypothetical protein [Candidatus Korarchaeota archaeon]NIU84993.1 hypothetical protein [Candidatus Thorarchaeota archaeon]NIW15015.1 hypothetical protein [Candidatus Thorarchaeota archaeon]NIW53025.1 hypothetical protein [Candidatus Korarchaeota archaeon]
MAQQEENEEKRKLTLFYWDLSLIVSGGLLTILSLSLLPNQHYGFFYGIFLLLSVSLLITGLLLPLVYVILRLVQKWRKKTSS